MAFPFLYCMDLEERSVCLSFSGQSLLLSVASTCSAQNMSFFVVVDRLRRRTMWFAAASGVLVALGMVGYVGGRLTADSRFVGVVFFGTYLVLAGLVLFALVLFINTPRMRRPVVSWAIGTLAILYGILFVAFPYDRAFAFPGAAIAASMAVLFVVGWSDICNPQVWKGTSDPYVGPVRKG